MEKVLIRRIFFAKLIKVMSGILLAADLVFICFLIYMLYAKISSNVVPVAAAASAAVLFIVIIRIFSTKEKKYTDEKNIFEQAEILREKQEQKRIERAALPSYINLGEFIEKEAHPDIQKLIITNYNIEDVTPKIVSEYLADITEPSLIDEHLEVNFDADIHNEPANKSRSSLSKFSSFSYERLTPVQRAMYLNFLKNPYESKTDIGCVMILLFGLERHIAYGESGLATEVIDKLREVRNEKIFSIPAYNALFYYNKKINMLTEFLKNEYYYLNLDFTIYYHLKSDKVFPSEAMVRFKNHFDFPSNAKEINTLLFQNEIDRLLEDSRGASHKPYQSTGKRKLGYSLEKFPYGSLLSDLESLPFPVNPSMGKLSGKYAVLRHLYNIEPFKTDISELLKRAYLNLVTSDKSFFKPR